MNHAAAARQGHKYKYGEREVIAMQSGVVVEVRPIVMKASWLTPLPMKYFSGSVPK